MKAFTVTVLLLLTLCWFACEIEGPASLASKSVVSQEVVEEDVDATDTWRRTKDGWEQNTSWTVEPPLKLPFRGVTAIHPATVAMLQLLVSLAALIAFDPTERRAS